MDKEPSRIYDGKEKKNRGGRHKVYSNGGKGKKATGARIIALGHKDSVK